MAAKTFVLLSSAVEGTTGNIENILDETAGSIGTIQTYSATITGNPDTVTISIHGSLDGVNWGILATHSFSAEELVKDSALFHITNRPSPWIKASVDALTAGTAPTVSVLGRVE